MNSPIQTKKTALDEEIAGGVSGGMAIGNGGVHGASTRKFYYCPVCKTTIALINGITEAGHKATHQTSSALVP